MGALKFGFIVVEGCGEQTMTAEHMLHQMVEVEGEVEYRLVPGSAETVLAAKCFAELTSVDAVLVFLPEGEHPLVLSAALNGLFDCLLTEVLVALLPDLLGSSLSGPHTLAHGVSLGLGHGLAVCPAGGIAFCLALLAEAVDYEFVAHTGNAVGAGCFAEFIGNFPGTHQSRLQHLSLIHI